MLVLCGSADLELLQQGQAGAARKGRRLRARRDRHAGRRAATEALRASPLGQDPVHPHRARPALREPGDPRIHRGRLSRAAAAARAIRSPRPRCASSRPSSTCTSSWSRASSIRRRSSAAASAPRRSTARVRAAGAQHRRVRAPGALRALSSPAPTFTPGRLLGLADLPLVVDGEPRRSTARTCWSPAASTGRPTRASIGERPSAQKVAADRKAWQDRAAAKT